MYQYEFDKVSGYISGYGLAGIKTKSEEYRKIIEKRAREGWRFVACIPSAQRGNGQIEEMDLVFEKEVNEDRK